MRIALTGAALLLAGTAPVFAGGIDRSGQFLGPLFEPGNYAELSFGMVRPSIDGTDVAGFKTGNVAEDYNQTALAYKHQFNPNLSAALIMDQSFGAGLDSPSVANGGSPVLGGTAADINAKTMTGVVRFVMPETGFGVHAGIRADRMDADVTLQGLAYGGISGYHADFKEDTAYGWLAGVSWEKPEIAARVALTYNSDIDHEFTTSESIGGAPIGPDGKTKVSLPKSVNLEFQTGVDPQTLVFGSIRWVDWSSFKVAPPTYGNIPDPCGGPQPGGGAPTCAPGTLLGSLTSLEDTTTLTLGVGRKFNENWSGAASFSYEGTGDDLVSPLAPANGRKGITLAAIYTRDNLKVTTGVSYIKLGNAKPETGTPDTARAFMTDNNVWGIGVKVGYSF